jgi:hypothetical protein
LVNTSSIAGQLALGKKKNDYTCIGLTSAVLAASKQHSQESKTAATGHYTISFIFAL